VTLVQSLAFALACLLVGLSKGGLGGPLPVVLVVPLLSLVMDPREAVPLTTPFLIFADWFALRIYWGKWDTRHLKLMIPFAILGIVMGGWFLAVVPSWILRLIIGVFTLLVVIYKLLADRLSHIEYTHHNWHGFLVGWLTGFASTIANTGGPAFTVYLLLQKLSPIDFISTATLFFAMVNLLKIPVFLQQNLLDVQVVLSVIWALPIVPFGVWLGKTALTRINALWFERMMMGLLILSVVLLLFSR
jgi:hypothetical protein